MTHPLPIPRPVPMSCRLNDGLHVLCFSRADAEHFYRDIFEARCYLRHGVTLEPGACVFDVGANIGLFALFALDECRAGVVFAFEPAPFVFELLRANTSRCLERVRLFEAGLSDRAKRAPFTFYPYNSGMSSFFGNLQEDRAVLERIMRNEIAASGPELGPMGECLPALLEQRTIAYACEARVRTVSEILDEHDVPAVDLLKIDVQKSELDVLNGIRDEHWPRIRQIVAEVHDLEGRCGHILGMLQDRGFRATSAQDPVYRETPLFTIFATRS